MSTPFENNSPEKICPRCQTHAAIYAPTCLSCGHVFRTQFTPTPEPTQMYRDPSPPLSPHPVDPADGPLPLSRKRPAKPLLILAAVIGVPAVLIGTASTINHPWTEHFHHSEVAPADTEPPPENNAGGNTSDVPAKANTTNDTSEMSSLELSDKLHSMMSPREVVRAIGEPDKIQKGMNGYTTDQYWYYRRRDGVLQIHFNYYNLLESYQTY